MLTQTECIPCILDDLVGAIKLLNLPPRDSERILSEALLYLGKIPKFQFIPPRHITRVHRILKRISGIDAPFLQLRHNCNRVGIELASRISRECNNYSNSERFAFLVRWSIAGNLLDFRTAGAGYGLEIRNIERMLRDRAKKGVQVDDTVALYNLLRDGGRKILYILDNVGEIAMDGILINEMVKLGNSVTATVRGGIITSDVTVDDAKDVALSSSGVAVVAEASDTLGLSWEEKTKEITDLLNGVDAVVAKGQANFCVFSEHKEEIPGSIFCLFTTKCEPVSGIFGFKEKVSLAVRLK